MPLYEYRCAECGHELEVLQKIADPAPVECPSCHRPALQKKLTAAGFQLKGTGWYVTDFRGGSGSKPAAESAPAADTAAAKPAGEAAATAAPATPAAAPAATPSTPGPGGNG